MRLRWEDLPETMRVAAESPMGAGVASDLPQTGGSSRGCRHGWSLMTLRA